MGVYVMGDKRDDLRHCTYYAKYCLTNVHGEGLPVTRFYLIFFVIIYPVFISLILQLRIDYT